MKKLLTLIVCVCVVSLGIASSAHSGAVFLKLDGIPGEATYVEHKDEIEVEAWSWQMSAPNLYLNSGAGSPIVRPLIIHKYIDRASPLLALALLNGTSITDGVLTVRTPGSPAEVYARIKMWDIHVVNLSSEISSDVDARIFETVALAFSKVCHEYTYFAPDGSPYGKIEKCWDIVGNVEF